MDGQNLTLPGKLFGSGVEVDVLVAVGRRIASTTRDVGTRERGDVSSRRPERESSGNGVVQRGLGRLLLVQRAGLAAVIPGQALSFIQMPRIQVVPDLVRSFKEGVLRL